jgi:NADP-dependent 3-hydroxy acid dehydrogenase YdfG
VSAATLVGKVAVVAGATSDIGAAIGMALARAGAGVHLLGRDRDKLQRVTASLSDVGAADVVAYPIDLTIDADVGALSALLHRAGRVDVLVHSAGVFERGPHAEVPIHDLDRQYRANVRAPYLLTQALLPCLRAHRGQIVFVNSTVGLEARAGVGQYASTQHALRAVADALRAEVNHDGVRVLTVYLGRTASERQARIFQMEGRDYVPESLMQPDDVAQMVMAALSLPSTAEVTEIRMRPAVKSY